MADRLLTHEELIVVDKQNRKQGFPMDTYPMAICKAQDAKTAPIVRRETAKEIFADLARYELSVNGITRLEIIGSHLQAIKDKYLGEVK